MNLRPAMAFLLTSTALLGPAAAQKVSAPEFDVASVKPFQIGSQPENRSITAAHGVLTIRQQTLRECIEWAYQVKGSDRIQGPAWIGADQFDILAKAPAATSEEQLRRMLQTLLARRFQLALHRKTEQLPVYSLTVDKGGPKLHAVDKAPVRGFHVDMEGRVVTYQLTTGMARLAELLPTFLDRPVLDNTGLTGIYEFPLRVQLEDEPHLPALGQEFQGFGMNPGVFEAVKTLGLKLVPQKGPLDVLVIDRVERPTAN